MYFAALNALQDIPKSVKALFVGKWGTAGQFSYQGQRQILVLGEEIAFFKCHGFNNLSTVPVA